MTVSPKILIIETIGIVILASLLVRTSNASLYTTSYAIKEVFNISEIYGISRSYEPVLLNLSQLPNCSKELCENVIITQCKEESTPENKCTEEELPYLKTDDCSFIVRINLTRNSWRVVNIYLKNISNVPAIGNGNWSFEPVDVDNNSTTGIKVESNGQFFYGVDEIIIRKGSQKIYSIRYVSGIFQFKDYTSNFDFREPEIHFHWHHGKRYSFMEKVNRFQIYSFGKLGMKIYANGERDKPDGIGNGYENITWYFFHEPLRIEAYGTANATTNLLVSGQLNPEAAAGNRPTVGFHKILPEGQGSKLIGWNGVHWKDWDPGSQQLLLRNKGAIVCKDIGGNQSGIYYGEMNNPEVSLYCEADKYDWDGLMLVWSSNGCFQIGDIIEPPRFYSYRGIFLKTHANSLPQWDNIVKSFSHPLIVKHIKTEKISRKNFSLPLILSNNTIIYSQKFSVIFSLKINHTAISNLTRSSVFLQLDTKKLPIIDFLNFHNGSYMFKTVMNITKLGVHQLQLKINYEGQILKNSTKIFVTIKPEGKRVLIITNNDWRNYIPAISAGYPVLVYNKTRKFIDEFISRYNPDLILKLNVNLSIPRSFYLDSPDDLAVIFFKNSEIVISKNKEVAIQAASLGLPILYNPEPETLEYLNPTFIHTFNSTNEVKSELLRKVNLTDIVAINPKSKLAMFASSIARKRKAIVIFATSESKIKEGIRNVIQKANKSLPMVFDKTLFLTLVGTPMDEVEDPVDEMFNDYDGKELKTDTPYGDLNNDGFLDLSVGRINGSVEQVSFQIEYPFVAKQTKTALMLTAYNTPGKFFDVMSAGGTMQDVEIIDYRLRRSGFKVTRLVERRSEFDELNMSIVKKLHELGKEFDALSSKTYENFLDLIFSGLRELSIVVEIGETLLYAIHEFDWADAWKSIANLEPHFPKHLPELTVPSILKHATNNSLLVYFSLGNSTHWFIPNVTRGFATNYTIFDPKFLPFNPRFAYLRHTKSYDINQKMLESGTVATVSLTGNSHKLYSSRTASDFFKNLNKPIGTSLIVAKNLNYEKVRYFQEHGVDLGKNYLKEYYITNLLGMPFIRLDPASEEKQSLDVEIKDGRFVASFVIKPEYELKANRSLFFKNPDDFIEVVNKPLVPVYRKVLLLPTGSKIEEVKAYASKTKFFDNISLPILKPDPEFSKPTSFVGKSPPTFFWNTSVSHIDNTTSFVVMFTPVIYYSNNSAEVAESLNFTLVYSAPLEITSIKATSVTLGSPSTVSCSVFSNFESEIEATVTLHVEGAEERIITRTVKLKPGRNDLKFSFKLEKEGEYSVSVALTYGKLIVGPKKTYFSVSKTKKRFLQPLLETLQRSFSSVAYRINNFLQSLSFKQEARRSNVLYRTQNETLEIVRQHNLTKIVFKFKGGRLTILVAPERRSYELKHTSGVYRLEYFNGEKEEYFSGDVATLRKVLREALSKVERKLEEIKVKPG